MTGLPTVTVKLDDGTGTYPFDVTTLTRLPESLSWSRGRSDEHSDNQPGSIAFAFDNTTGAFTAGRANLIVAPSSSFEDATVGAWTAVNSAAVANSVVRALSGTHSMRVTWPTGTGIPVPAGQMTLAGLTIGQTYTYSAFVYVPAGSVDVKLAVFTLGNSAVMSTKDAWTRITITVVATATSHLLQIVPQGATTAGQTAYVDYVEVVVGTSATYAVTPDQGVRLLVNGATRWAGSLQAAPVSWPSGDDTLALVKAAATDPLARLSRWQLETATVLEVLKDSPSGFWPLNEDSQFATQGRDLSGQQVALAIYNGGPFADPNITLATFGQDLGTPDGAKGVQLNSAAGGIGNEDLRPAGGDGHGLTYTGSSLHVEVTFNLSDKLGTGKIELVQFSDGVGTNINGVIELTAGNLAVKRGLGDVTYNVTIPNKAGLHTVALDTDGTSSHIWYDHAIVDSRAGFAHSYDLTDYFAVGSLFVSPGTGDITCVVGNVIVGPKLGDTRTGVHQDAVMNDLSGETVTARITRVVGYTSIPLGTIDAAGDTILGEAGQGGRSVLDVLAEIAAADLGDAFADANGAVSYVAGASLVAVLTPAIIGSQWLDETTEVIVDMFGVVNKATGQSSSGGNAFGPIVDEASVDAHGDYPQSYAWNVNTDAQVLDRTSWIVATYSEPTPRVGQLVLDLLTMDATTLTAALTLDLAAYLRVTGMPAQTPGGTQLDLIVESITETIAATLTDSVWTLTLNLSAKALRTAWLLDDTTYSVLDSTTKLYI